MKYFLHDTNSFEDEKITLLFLEFGYEGLGLFYTLLEKVAKQEKPINTSVLKSQLKVGKKLNKCWNFMESIGIVSSNNGETFNERILSYSETYQIKNKKNRERISLWRDNQTDIKNVTSYETVSEHVRNAPKGKVNRSKVNRSKDINISFDVFWDLYDKKDGRVKSEIAWENLTDSDREKIMEFIPKYIKKQPEKKYRKNPMTFFNNRSWLDEEINSLKSVSINQEQPPNRRDCWNDEDYERQLEKFNKNKTG